MTETATSLDIVLPPLPVQPSMKQLQEYARPMAKAALDTAFQLLRTADNDSVRIGAAKLILAKVLPDMKSMDFTANDGQSLIAVLLSSVKKDEK